MAIGAAFFTGAASAVGDIFAGAAAKKGLYIKASGTEVEADSTKLNAEAQRLNARGNTTEAGNYDLASTLAEQNVEYTKQNEAVQQTMADRNLYLNTGAIKGGIAGAGLTSDSSSDLLADSARQGAIAKQLMGEQALITEAGFDEQAKSYTNLADYARYGASVQNDMAGKLDLISGKQMNIAAQERELGDTAEKNSWITAGIKGAGAIASLFTGGMSLPGMGGGGGGPEDAGAVAGA